MRVDEFFNFMIERHRIYVKKSSGEPFPWTDDPILQKYKFCNVYRELDTGTIWCREHIREPFADHPSLFFNIAAYRSVNALETWEEIYEWEEAVTGVPFMEVYDPERVRHAMKLRKARGCRIFTNAHMLTGLHAGDKIDQCVDYTFRFLWEHRQELEPTPNDSLKSAFDKLIAAKIPAIGKFLAYEIVTDLRHTRYLSHAMDKHCWANPGNGARRGIERVMGCYEVGRIRNWDPDYLVQRMVDLLDVSRIVLPDWMPKLEMREIEHTLCEFDKYERARLGEGTPRMHYIPAYYERNASNGN